jgi:tetratricopeptide (TPR) repeat protein
MASFRCRFCNLAVTVDLEPGDRYLCIRCRNETVVPGTPRARAPEPADDQDQRRREAAVRLQSEGIIHLRADFASKTEFELTRLLLKATQLGDHAEVIRCLDELLRRNIPVREQWLTEKGNALRRMLRFEDSVTVYDEVLQIDPRRVDALAGKAMSLDKLSRFEESLRCWDAVLVLEPNRDGARQNRDAAEAALVMQRDSPAPVAAPSPPPTPPIEEPPPEPPPSFDTHHQLQPARVIVGPATNPVKRNGLRRQWVKWRWAINDHMSESRWIILAVALFLLIGAGVSLLLYVRS